MYIYYKRKKNHLIKKNHVIHWIKNCSLESLVPTVSHESLRLIECYLSNRRQGTKIKKSFSKWANLLQCVPLGSFLWPLLFNIYLNNLFFLCEFTKVSNFSDDTTFFTCDKDLGSIWSIWNWKKTSVIYLLLYKSYSDKNLEF